MGDVSKNADFRALAAAAECYVILVAHNGIMMDVNGIPQHWPFSREAWKPKNVRCDLVQASVLITAAINKYDIEQKKLDTL